jgi:hypothetical protein
MRGLSDRPLTALGHGALGKAAPRQLKLDDGKGSHTLELDQWLRLS